MPTSKNQVRQLFDELKPGDRIEVEQTVTAGSKRRTTKISGLVVRTERRRQRAHFLRDYDQRVFSDLILLELPDGELTIVTMDELTELRRA